jgi:KDO2-lipid IV(A) lauroyltransferase
VKRGTRRPKSRARLEAEDLFILSTVRALQAVFNALPLRAALAVGSGLGALYARFAKRRMISYRNLRACFGGEKTPAELRRIVRENYRCLLMTIVEMLRFPVLDRRYVETHVAIGDLGPVDRAVAAGRGMILLTAHFGNWELLNIVGSVLGYPMTVFARPQKHPRSDAFLNGLRASRGAEVVRKGISARQVVHALGNGRLLGVLADQDAGQHGVFVPFFGRASSSPRGVVRFACRTGSSILPVFAVRDRADATRHRIVFGREVRVPPGTPDEEAEVAVMAAFAAELEAQVRRHPEQWLWPHRRWKSSPDRTCVILSDGKVGHLNQCRAVVEALVEARLGRGVPARHTHVRTIEVRYRHPAARAALVAWGVLTRGRFPFGLAALRAALDRASYAAVRDAWADYVVSCGAGLEPVNVILARENGARACLIHRPQFGTRPYAAVLVPRHDRYPDGARVIRTDGAVVRRSPAGDAAAFLRGAGLDNGAVSLGRLGLVLGGPSRRTPWEAAALPELVESLKALHRERPYWLFATTSRRTPAAEEAFLDRELGSWPACRALVLANRSNPEGAYAGILAASDVLAVTADSVSMISEAVRTGKPVIAVLPNAAGALDPKVREFLRDLEGRGRAALVRPAEAGGAVRRALENGGAPAAEPEALSAVDRAVEALIGG